MASRSSPNFTGMTASLICDGSVNSNIRMTASAKRIGLAALAISLVLLSSGGIVGTALAQTTTGTPSCELKGPEDLSSCENPSLNPFKGFLDNLYDIAHALLQYSGFVMVFLGSTLWLTADKNSSRGQTGLWFFAGGLALIVLYFSMTTIISLAKGIAEGGAL